MRLSSLVCVSLVCASGLLLGCSSSDDADGDDDSAAGASLCEAETGMGVYSGTVKDEAGDPMEGVMVRLHKDVGLSESVFTNAEGEFSLATHLSGVLRVRLRLPYFDDVTANLELGEGEELSEDHVMEATTGDAQISNSLPAAFHFGQLPFDPNEDDEFSRSQFRMACLHCHQMGNPYTRVPRTAEGWQPIMDRMDAEFGTTDRGLSARRSAFLSAGFNGQLVTARPEFPLDPSLAYTKIYEVEMASTFAPHDAIFNPNDGLIYTVDQGVHQMVVTDMETGDSEYVTGEPGDGPHSLDMGLDGNYYVTNANGNNIGVFNPETREWEARLGLRDGLVYPHTIRVGADGMVWFTMTAHRSAVVARLDPATGEFDFVESVSHTPTNGASGITEPYGIDISPTDGFVWYGRLMGDKIGKIDPVTLEVTEYDSPVRGPRRMRFDESGILWLAGWTDGEIVRIDPDGFETTVYPMPRLVDEIPGSPYALGVHPETQDIWVNETMHDRIYRFIPDEERWIMYPVPLSGTYTRDMTFTDDGKICMSNHAIPRAALEDGVLGLLCFKVGCE